MFCKTRWVVMATLFLGFAAQGCNKGGASSTAPPAVAPAPHVADADAGAMLYGQGCVTCHGPTGQGLAHQGPELRHNQFVATNSDADLIAFLRKGRPTNDPTNKTKQLMPAGGKITGFGEDPQSDTETLADVVAFLRHMQSETRRKDALAAARIAPATQSISSSATQPTTAPATAFIK